MKTNSKTFRLFLSSTFNDMRAERDELQKKVFPRLREYCDKHGFSFQPIDLRWGVSSEAGNDQKTMQICIDEVQRCKNALTPHFAIILGERYGWIPLPAQVEAKEFELVKEAVIKRYSDKTIVIDMLNRWYRLDTNATKYQYILQVRTGEFEKWDKWGEVENTLRDVFMKVVTSDLQDVLDEKQKAKYLKSATEQEIVEGLFKNVENKDNIYFYNRDFENIDEINAKTPHLFDELEKKDKEYKKIDSTYQVTVKQFSDFENFTGTKLDSEIRPYHKNLIEHIKSELPQENTTEYKLQLGTSLERTQDSITQKYLDKFCEDFYKNIFVSMEKEIESFEEQDKQTRELQEQEDFMKKKSKIFVGREEFLKKIDNYIKVDETNAPLVIYADSGSGKSALMAKTVANSLDNTKDNNDTRVIYRFVGTSELSNNPSNLYQSIYTQFIEDEALETICDEYLEEKELEKEKVLSDIKELSKMIANLLENYPEEKKLVLFVDALDQFMLNDSLQWLPRILNVNTKVIISTLPDTYQGVPYLPKLKQKYKNSEENFLYLEAFKSDEADAMIDEYLASYHRTLTAKQKEKVLDSFLQSGSPLYLKILLEEAIEWHSYSIIEGEEYNYPKELDDLVTRLFTRLHTHSHHSLPLVHYAFAYIACSKDGLSEPELFDILSLEADIMEDVSNEFYPKPQRLPTAVWARLYSQMQNYLSIKEIDGMDQISFFHRKFDEGAYKLNLNFLKEKDKYKVDDAKETTKEDIHSKLADFYTKIYEKRLDIQTTEESALTELPYQLIMSKQKEKSLELLTNFEFLMKKFKLNRTSEVMEDYALAKAEGMNDE